MFFHIQASMPVVPQAGIESNCDVIFHGLHGCKSFYMCLTNGLHLVCYSQLTCFLLVYVSYFSFLISNPRFPILRETIFARRWCIQPHNYHLQGGCMIGLVVWLRNNGFHLQDELCYKAFQPICVLWIH